MARQEKERKKEKYINKDVEESESSGIAGGHVRCAAGVGNRRKSNVELPSDPVIGF